MPIGKQSFNKPAPRWFRLTKKIINLVTNFTMAILLVIGYGAESLTLLIIKLTQSFVMDTLDTLISNGEVYAQEDTKTETVTLTQTVVDATDNTPTAFSKPAAPGDSQIQNNK